nr:hypothetical protein [Tanacetum cinerariifolium]
MSNSEGSMNKEEMKESSKKLKRKFKTLKGYEGVERIMLKFILKGFTKSKIWDKVKEPISPKLNEDEYSIFCENTTHMMNALKEVRMESREMLLSIHYSLKMLLDIISKINRKLEDEKVKMNDKGKEKLRTPRMMLLTHGSPPWNKGEKQSKRSMYNDIYSFVYKDINLQMKEHGATFLN